MANRNRNKFCSLDDLTNEASVEQFFVSRLLVDLGYRDSQIKPKMSLQTLVVNLGRRKLNYKPDYAIEVESQIRWIIDAKSTTEGLDDYVGQCAGYCLNLNRGYNDENPVLYFMLTNGILTQIYEWDREEPILELNFSDFDDNNGNYKRLRDLLQMSVFTGNRSVNVTSSGDGHTLYRKSISDVNSDFAWCHQFIYKKDNLSQSAAFMEFIKIVFLKLLSDRDIHRKYPSFSSQTEITLPTQEVKFSEHWIEERESDHPNPLDALQFHTLLQSLESEIQTGERKRIFDANEHINLTPETIKGVVRRLENTDLFGIDADLNGRLFETFLNATMRGKDLGQFFTPRSVVKLTVRLANIRVSREHVDTVIDACCGTGGFLIDAFGDMLHKIEMNKSLTDQESKDLQRLIATQRVYGIDIAVDPPLARIARINMYLHGDGGSSIYQADILDKAIEDIPTDSPEKKREKAELRDMLASGGFADVVLTNPPFAKEYKREFVRDDRILDEYVLAFEKAGGKRKPRSSLKSSLMFLERYYDMLKPAGRMLTVIDDSVLGGTKYRWVRDYIREKFIIRGVISLPGDAFQRSKARVKTSILYLQKKRHPDEEQPPIFMYYCTTVGIDDPARQRVLPIDEQNRIIANREIEEAGAAFEAFLAGDPSVNKWIVSPDAIQDRMDVKSVLLTPV